jgi:hypothetical protein
MTIYRIQIQKDNSVKVLETKNKPRGMVLNPHLSSMLLMKYPRLANGNIITLRASQLYLLINQYYES